MPRIVITWQDRDGSRSVHEFATAEEAEVWLRDVLQEYCPAEQLEASGYTPDGIGMLAYYTDECLDDVGSIEVFGDGLGVTPDELPR